MLLRYFITLVIWTTSLRQIHKKIKEVTGHWWSIHGHWSGAKRQPSVARQNVFRNLPVFFTCSNTILCCLLSVERNPFSANNQTLTSYRVDISLWSRHHQLLFK